MKLRPKGTLKKRKEKEKHWSHIHALMIAVSERRSADSQSRSQKTQLLLYQSHFANHYIKVHENFKLPKNPQRSNMCQHGKLSYLIH